MSFTVTAVVGDADRVVGVTLRTETAPRVWSAVDLTGVSLTCRLEPVSGVGETLVVSGLTGSSVGVVSTPLSTVVAAAGQWFMEWKVADGDTFPSAADDRPRLIVREAA